MYMYYVSNVVKLVYYINSYITKFSFPISSADSAYCCHPVSDHKVCAIKCQLQGNNY